MYRLLRTCRILRPGPLAHGGGVGGDSGAGGLYG